jgi:hypothetical protein
MIEHHERPIDPIDAYVDGLMDHDERAAFEGRIAADAKLRAQVELQNLIDDRIRATMAPPPVPAPLPAPTTPRSPLSMPRTGLPAWARIAAVLALVASGAAAFMWAPWRTWFKPQPSVLTANAVMKRLVDDGFKPIWTCDNDEKFLAYTKEKLGIQFLVHPSSDVQVVGWTYAGGLLADSKENAQVLLARAGNEHVIVAMGPARDDREIRRDCNSLNVHKSVHHGVVMYEISRLDHPVIINAIEDR